MSESKVLTQSYYRNPVRWNVGIILTCVSMVGGGVAWYVSNELQAHDTHREAHESTLKPIEDRLKAIEAKQIREEIYTLDSRLCASANKRAIREKLAELFTEYQRITGTAFPRELLECI